MLSRIFEPFYTTKPSTQGTGLGLWVSHRIVTSLGGRIMADSRPGGGACFRVALRAAVGAQAPSPSRPTTAQTPHLRILAVDDEPALLSLLCAWLDGHSTVAAGSVQAALEALHRDARFDLILCDIMMPGRTGIELFEEVRVRHPGLEDRIVFMSGGTFTPRATEFLTRIPNLCIEKPFDAPTMAKVLAAAAARMSA